MAVLYQAKGSKAVADASWHGTQSTGGPDLRSSTFFNKHIRIIDKLPSQAEMIQTVDEIWADRKKSPASAVVSPLGETRKKKDLYGNAKPPGNTTLFVTKGGFQAMNAYIEQSVNSSGDHWIPIPAGGVVAGKEITDKAAGTIKTSVFDSGYWEISIEVGAVVAGMKSKLVYHFGGVKRNL